MMTEQFPALTKIQQAVLLAMVDHGGTWPESSSGGNWVWNNVSETRRIMDSLHRKGLVLFPEYGKYKVSPLGKNMVERLAPG